MEEKQTRQEWMSIYTPQIEIYHWWDSLSDGDKDRLDREFSALEDNQLPATGWPDGVDPGALAGINEAARKMKELETQKIAGALPLFNIPYKDNRAELFFKDATPKRVNQLFYYEQERARQSNRPVTTLEISESTAQAPKKGGGIGAPTDLGGSWELGLLLAFLGLLAYSIFGGLKKVYDTLKDLWHWKNPLKNAAILLVMAGAGYAGWVYAAPHILINKYVIANDIIVMLFTMAVAAALIDAPKAISWLRGKVASWLGSEPGSSNLEEAPIKVEEAALTEQQKAALKEKDSNIDIDRVERCITNIVLTSHKAYSTPARNKRLGEALQTVKTEGLSQKAMKQMASCGIYPKKLESLNTMLRDHQAPSERGQLTALEAVEICTPPPSDAARTVMHQPSYGALPTSAMSDEDQELEQKQEEGTPPQEVSPNQGLRSTEQLDSSSDDSPQPPTPDN